MLRLALLSLTLFAFPCNAQWVPRGSLASVLVAENCGRTKGDIAVYRFEMNRPVIYFCQQKANELNATWPGVGHFYYVHEYGHAAKGLNETTADCWAAQQISGAPNGEYFLDAAIQHFKARGDERHSGYLPAYERANTIIRCAKLDRQKVERPGSERKSPRDEYSVTTQGSSTRCRQSPRNKEHERSLRGKLESAERELRFYQEREAFARDDEALDKRRSERALARGDREDARYWREQARRDRERVDDYHRNYIEYVGKVAALRCELGQN